MSQELSQTIKRLERDLDRAKQELAQLAEMDKPKLRHGDYGYTRAGGGKPRFFTQSWVDGENQEGKMQWCDDEAWHGTGDCLEIKSFIITGNLVDDLERNAEPLEEFELDVHCYKFDFMNFCHAPILIAGNWHTMDEAVDFHQKFGQLIATAKRKQNVS